MATSKCVDVLLLPLFHDPSYRNPRLTPPWQTCLRLTPTSMAQLRRTASEAVLDGSSPRFSWLEQNPGCPDVAVLRPLSTSPPLYRELSVADRCQKEYKAEHSSTVVYSRPSKPVLSEGARRCRQDLRRCSHPSSHRRFRCPSERSFEPLPDDWPESGSRGPATPAMIRVASCPGSLQQLKSRQTQNTIY